MSQESDDILERVAAIENMIKLRYDPSANGQDYWETGNFDDTFSMGRDNGTAETLCTIGRMLGMDLPDVEEMEL